MYWIVINLINKAMGVFKEEAYTFDVVAKKQRQIYNDACDYGFAYDISNRPKEINDLFESIDTFKALDEKYPDEPKFIIKRETWKVRNMGGVTIVIRIAWEHFEGKEYGSEYTISYNFLGYAYDKKPNALCPGCNAFISVDCSRYEIPIKK
jgi:hypothetical protein